MTPRQKYIYGMCLLCSWVVLILSIALGKVEEATSYGLTPCITGLSFLSGLWAQSTFGGAHAPTEPPKQEEGPKPPPPSSPA